MLIKYVFFKRMEFFKDWQILFYFISFNVSAIWTVKKSEPLDQKD